MKRIIVLLLVVLSLGTISAGDHQDISLSFGMDNYKWWMDGISFSYGANLGLTERLELNAWGISELIDKPFSENVFGLELSYALMGRRSSASIVAGAGINTLVGIGGFYKTIDNGAGPIVTITPLTVGNPITGKRERLLRTGIGWDFVNSQLFVSFSLINIDLYLRGTYRDYEY